MMERRQTWLEEQFLQQGKDLLKLSRQIHVIQDFITLHFDSFRDYSMERERGERRVDEMSMSQKCSSQFSLPRSLSPYQNNNNVSSQNFRCPPNVNSDNTGIYERDNGMLDNPVDLSEFPSSSDYIQQRPISPLDLSVSSTNWDNNPYNNQEEEAALHIQSHHQQSPSPILSRSSLPHALTPDGFKFKSERDISDRESSEDENDVTYPASSSSRNSLYPKMHLPTSSSSPYNSVLRSILRTEPPITTKIKYEQVNATLPIRTYESSQLHWSSGTVTSSATAATVGSSAFRDSDDYNDNGSNALNLVGGIKIKREDTPDYERQDRTCSGSEDVVRLLPSSQLIVSDSTVVSESQPESHSRVKSKGKNSRRTKTSTSSKPPSEPKKPKNRQGRNTSTPNSGGTVESSSSSNQGTKKCRFCGKTFQWSHSVKTHERLHTGEKPYLCKLCGTRFTQNGNLKVHAKTCVGKYAEMYKSKNVFVCPLCTEMFQSMDALMAHQKSHDRMQWSDKDKTCRYCGKMFQKRSLLLAHELIHGQGEEEDDNDDNNLDEDDDEDNGDDDVSKTDNLSTHRFKEEEDNQTLPREDLLLVPRNGSANSNIIVNDTFGIDSD